ncbi:MAG: translocation protein TolB [Gimesia chilikensis]|uniref:translocation protein TolB n=1 Tax=Gimesia chilikensis TaxID=2605989 RepID=UPI003794B61E
MHFFNKLLTLFCTIGLICQAVLSSHAAEKTNVKRVRFYQVSPEGGTAKLFLVPGEFHTAGSPVFSPDGTKFAFDGRKSQQGESFSNGKVLVCNADGSQLNAIGSGVMPSWSPVGNRIACSSISPRGAALMHADGTQRELIVPDSWGAQWSPDGRKIAYTFYGPGGITIQVYDLIEGTKISLFSLGDAPYKSIYWNMAWSPDSNWLCFKGRRSDDGTYDIATINAAGKAAGYKVHFNSDKAPYADMAWDPRGDRIVFGSPTSPRQLLQFNPAEDKAPAPIDIQVTGDIIGDVCFSPDGQSLVFNVSGTEE